MDVPDLAQVIEEAVKKHFEAYGCEVRKLDEEDKTQQRADYLISKENPLFLCEVKAIKSGRANFSYKTTAPTTKYAQSEFDKFTQDLRAELEHRGLEDIPFQLRIDNDYFYCPTKDEREEFIEWLVIDLSRFSRGEIVPSWRYSQQYSSLNIFDREYRFKSGNKYSLLLFSTPDYSGKFILETHAYGTINLDPIPKNLRDALTQLKNTPANEDTAKLIALYISLNPFEFEQEFQMLKEEISLFLYENEEVSGIALIQWFPVDIFADDLSEWLDDSKQPKPTLILFCRANENNILLNLEFFEHKISC